MTSGASIRNALWLALRQLADPRLTRLLMMALLIAFLNTGPFLAAFLAVPLVNLLVPIVGVAAYTHLYQQLSKTWIWA